jgi:oligopeptidase B
MRSHQLRAVVSSFVVLVPWLLAQEPAQPPVAKRVEHKQEWHGRTFTDPWFWLREKSNPEVVAYIEAENAFTASVTAAQKPLQEKLYAELVARVKQTDLSAPVRDGGFWYYSRTVEGRQYPIFCRKVAGADGALDEKAAEQVLLDQNEMSKGLTYLGIDEQAVSDDGNLLAYSTDVTGFRQHTLHVKDLRSGAITADLCKRVTSIEWAADGKTLFFATEHDVTKRSDQVWRLELGADLRPTGAPELVFEEKDELFRVGLTRTRDNKYLMIGSGSTDSAEWRWLDAGTPRGEWRVLLPRKKGQRYRFDHRGGSFFVVTDDKGPNFRVVQVPVGAADLAAGKEIVAHKDGVLVSGFDVFADFAIAVERAQALARFRVFDFARGTWREITFPEPVYSASAGGTPEFTSRSYRINYQSLVTPSSVYDHDLATGERTLRKSTEVAGYDATKYRTERLWAKARDGVQVPISIVYRDGHPRDGTAPLWLYAYGSYGFAMPATFDSNRVSLLDRGVAFAIAHIRGGNDLGERWHLDGMLMKKKNTFFDFIDCAEFLVAEKWTGKDRLVIEGGSAGGLLMGAVANLRPDLFRAVHSAVPFVDVMNTMMDASLPLTVGEYLEWGNPNEAAAFDYMLSYSPYDNLAAKAYPPTLVTTSFNDSQVMYWEPTKYVAKLRSLLPGDQRQLLLKCKLEAAGHGGASGRYDRWRDRAFEMAWMLHQVGITQ